MPFLGRTITTNLADFHTDNYAAGSGFTAGSTTSLALSISGIDDENALRISFDGVNQHHDTWSLSSSTVTFDTAIPTGVANVEIQYGKQPTSSAFEANSVDGSHIALGSDAQGDVLYYDGSNYARLAAGTSGQFLKTQGSSANPTWASVTDPALVFVSTQVASSSASIEFTGIDNTSDMWMVVLQGVNAATDNQILSMRTSNDASSHSYDSGASDYNWSMTGLYFGDDYSKYDTADAQIAMGADPNLIGNDADIGLSGTVYIHKPSDTALDTGITYNVYQQNGANNFQNLIGGGHRVANEAVTAIQFLFLSGNIDSGRFSMYKLLHS